MPKDLNKRIVVRVSDAQLEWITAWAADEGVDNATFVRMVIDRLSKGRPPLMGMIAEAPLGSPGSGDADGDVILRAGTPSAAYVDGVKKVIGDLTEAHRSGVVAAEAADYGATQESVPEHTVAAIPLHKPERVRFNPGRG